MSVSEAMVKLKFERDKLLATVALLREENERHREMRPFRRFWDILDDEWRNFLIGYDHEDVEHRVAWRLWQQVRQAKAQAITGMTPLEQDADWWRERQVEMAEAERYDEPAATPDRPLGTLATDGGSHEGYRS